MSNPVDTAAIKAALSELIAEPWEYIEDDYAIVAPDLCIQDRIETHEFGRGIVLLRNTASSLVEEVEAQRALVDRILKAVDVHDPWIGDEVRKELGLDPRPE